MKKFFAFALVALLLLGACSLSAFAEEGTVAFVAFNGNDSNDGLSAATPKKSWKTFEDVGVMSLLQNGGTLVAVQKAYLGSSYSLPAMSAPLTITAVHDGVDYRNPEPAENPASGVFKMASGATFTLNSDVTFDNIIMFQENNQNTIVVPLGVTLTVTDTVDLLTKPGNDYHYAIKVEMGGTAILSKAAQETFTIENLGGTVKTYGGEDIPTTPAETTAAPVETTAAPAETTAAPVETTAAPAETTAAPVETTVAPVETTAAPVETTAAPAETTAAPVETTATPVETTTAPASSTGESTAPIGMILAIVGAVVVVAVVVIVLVKKKK